VWLLPAPGAPHRKTRQLGREGEGRAGPRPVGRGGRREKRRGWKTMMCRETTARSASLIDPTLVINPRSMRGEGGVAEIPQ